MAGPGGFQDATKDDYDEHPVPSAWRPTLFTIVKAFTKGDYGLARGIPSVAPVEPAAAAQIKCYIGDYGETLAELPDETWKTSTSVWADDHWDVYVDLWTVESGSSDMVLGARVYEAAGGFRIVVDLVYVP